MIRSYGLKPREVTAFNRLLPRERELFYVLLDTGMSLERALRMAVHV